MAKKDALAEISAEPGEALPERTAGAYAVSAEAIAELSRPINTAADALRVQAGLLREAVLSARHAGYVVNLPFPLEALDRIAISETAKVGQ